MWTEVITWFVMCVVIMVSLPIAYQIYKLIRYETTVAVTHLINHDEVLEHARKKAEKEWTKIIKEDGESHV